MGLKDFLQGKPLGHPSHPLFVHFPSALFPTGLLLDILAWFFQEPALVKAAFYDIAVGSAGGLLAALTGFVDYFGMIPGSRKHAVTTWHWLIQVSVLGIFLLSLVLRWPLLGVPQTPLPIVLLSAIGVLGLLVGSYLGGELVYRMGMRVSTGPRPTPALLALLERLLAGARGFSLRDRRPVSTIQSGTATKERGPLR